MLDGCQETLREEEGTEPEGTWDILRFDPTIEELISFVEIFDPREDRFVGEETHSFPNIRNLGVQEGLADFIDFSIRLIFIVEGALDFSNTCADFG